jgi:hypothetical protein
MTRTLTPKKIREKESSVAEVTVRIIGAFNEYKVVEEMSTDLADDDMGGLIGDALRYAWKHGEDPVNCVMVMTFA